MPTSDSKPPSIIERYKVKPTPANAALGALLIWVVAATLLEYKLDGLALLFTLLLSATAVFGVLAHLREEARTGFARFLLTALVLLTGFWFYFSGSYLSWKTLAWDVGSLLVGGVTGTTVALIGFTLAARRYKVCAALLEKPETVFAIILLLAGWAGITVVSGWRSTPLPRDVARFENIVPEKSIVASHALRWQDLRVGLALSGGGYRAAVYHAGTLHALERLGIRAHVLSTVSGGSIIGSYYALGGNPRDFKDAVAAGRFNLKREISLANNALQLAFPITIPVLEVPLFPWHDFNRSDVQAGLLRKVMLGDEKPWREPASKQPRLVVNTTELTFGAQVGLLPDGAVVIWVNNERRAFMGKAWKPREELPLALQVAISGAFPGAFPARPVKVRPAFPSENSKLESYERLFASSDRPLMLADGGIFDNTGEAMLRALDDFARQPPGESGLDPRYASDVFLVSDGGAVFGVETKLDDLGQVIRAADIMSALSQRNAGQTTTVSFAARDNFLSLADQFRHHGAIAAAQRLTGEERTKHALTKSGFDAQATYPQAVLDQISELLPGKVSASDKLAFRRALSDAMDKKLATFRATSTLDDLLAEDQAEDLYALGQLMVYIAWPRLERAMNNALETVRSSPQLLSKP